MATYGNERRGKAASWDAVETVECLCFRANVEVGRTMNKRCPLPEWSCSSKTKFADESVTLILRHVESGPRVLGNVWVGNQCVLQPHTVYTVYTDIYGYVRIIKHQYGYRDTLVQPYLGILVGNVPRTP